MCRRLHVDVVRRALPRDGAPGSRFHNTNRGRCYPILAESAMESGATEQLSVGLAAGQSVRVWVGNSSPRSVTYTLTIEMP